MIRKILHIDLDAFFCAVEEINNPGLKNLPFAVGGQPNQRGVVSSCSYTARKFGIHSAMPMSRAMRNCPHLIVIKPHFQLYSSISKGIMSTLQEFTPLFEQISIDEAFLDVSDLPESAYLIAKGIQAIINENFKLPCSIGVATSKLVAKIATDFGKSQHIGKKGHPNAITCVEPGKEKDFLAPLRVEAIQGIGKKTAERLHTKGIYSIGDISRIQKSELISILGKFGESLHYWSRGIDNRPIASNQEIKSISREITFTKDIDDLISVHKTVRDLANFVCMKLRQKSLLGSVVKLKIRWHDFTTITRQITLNNATDDERIIYEAYLELINKVWKQNKPVRLIGLGVSGLTVPIIQLSLWDNQQVKERRLLHAIDELQKKYGKEKLSRGHSE